MAVNLVPKFNHASKITNNVLRHMNNILENPITIPCFLNGTKYHDNIHQQVSSYNNSKIISYYSTLPKARLTNGLNSFKKNQIDFALNFTPKQRIDVFEKAANLLEHKYYDKMLAYTIVSQNKTIYEAEIDAVCELVDFLRFNSFYYQQILDKQPINIDTKITNTSSYNPLNGFVASITPFNFTAIGGNLATAPLLFGNSVFWKPSDNSILSNYLFYEILLEANLPDNILNFTPMNANDFANTTLSHPDLAAVLFTGSSNVFDNMYKTIGNNINKYNNYVRIVGETGGKNYHFIHNEIDDLKRVVKLTIESAYNYSGQKCSACSRVYIPRSLFNKFISIYFDQIEVYKKTQHNYGLINDKSFMITDERLENIKNSDNISILYGGNTNQRNNQYYVEPTLLHCKDHSNDIFHEEFFSPILSCYVYDDSDIDQAIDLCLDNKYALTGAIFSNNTKFIEYFLNKSMFSCGNFYINDKSTGSVVGQQPFGGSGKSGTNDKAGDINLLYRLFNQQNIKRIN